MQVQQGSEGFLFGHPDPKATGRHYSREDRSGSEIRTCLLRCCACEGWAAHVSIPAFEQLYKMSLIFIIGELVKLKHGLCLFFGVDLFMRVIIIQHGIPISLPDSMIFRLICFCASILLWEWKGTSCRVWFLDGLFGILRGRV